MHLRHCARTILATAWRSAGWIAQTAGRRCQLCLAVQDQDAPGLLCARCARALAPRLGGYCPCCGSCYSDAQSPIYACATCRLAAPPWSRLGFYAPYDGALKELIHRYKFGQDHGVGKLLAYLIQEIGHIHGLGACDMVVPVPMRHSRLVRRGFNQSAELARMAAKYLGGEFRPQGLRKIRETSPQSLLGRRARLENVRGTFVADAECAGQRILLVDDVMTTGATLLACAKACLAQGAHQVDVLVLARALGW